MFEDFAAEYLSLVKGKRSFRAFDQRVRRLTGCFRGKLLVDITPYDVERYQAARSAQYVDGTTRLVTPAEVNHDLTVMKSLFNTAIRAGSATANPVCGVKMSKVDNFSKTRYLDQKEARALLVACKAGPAYLHPLVTVALGTAMRKGELLGLTWGDIDYARGVIHIREAKGGVGRSVDMNNMVRTALRSCMSVDGVIEDRGQHIFRSGHGDRLRVFHRIFQLTLARAGIKNFRFHDLRHTAATLMINNGVELATIQKVLGHKTIAMTMRYAHLFPTQTKIAVDRLGSALGDHGGNTDNLGSSGVCADSSKRTTEA